MQNLGIWYGCLTGSANKRVYFPMLHFTNSLWSLILLKYIFTILESLPTLYPHSLSPFRPSFHDILHTPPDYKLGSFTPLM
jgi:hypothetical protein